MILIERTRKKIKIISRILPVLLMVVLLMGCGTSQVGGIQGEDAKEEEDGKLKIGIVFDSFVIDRWETDRDVFTSTAKELGADVIVGNANGDASNQASIVTHMVEEECNVIVIIPVDSTTLLEPVQQAQRAGIKIICYDRIITGAGADLYITFDNEKVGEYMAMAINESAPENGNYIKLRGPETDYNVEMVNAGFDRVIRSDLTMIGEMSCADWNDQLAYDYLSYNVDLVRKADAIMGGNDAVAGQAVRVLAENRRAGQVIVTGQDADLEACQHIIAGTQAMTVYKPIENLATQAAEVAVAMAKGEAPETDQTINDGSADIPYIVLDPILVTKENMDDTVIAGGFHLKEDVYRSN